MAKKVVVLGMGGTIAGTAESARDNVGYQAGTVPVQDLLKSVPGLIAQLGTTEIFAEQVCQIDSKDLEHGDWIRLHERAVHFLALPEVLAVVVSHGTDTLEETAFFLSKTLPPELLARKPLVMTCAMRPASSLTSDGPVNLADATAVALTPGARGVVVVCAGMVHAAVHVQKVHPYRLDAFDSGEAGPVGLVEEGRLRLLHGWPEPENCPGAEQLQKLAEAGFPRVEIVLSHAGVSGAVVRSLGIPIPGVPPLRGLVVAGTGNGTLHRALEQALQEASAQGVRVLRVSRCPYGQIVDSTPALQSGAMASVELSAVKARIALMLELAGV